MELIQIKNTNLSIFVDTELNGLVDKMIKASHFWEKRTADVLIRYADKDKVSIDIGANIGFHSLIMSKFSKTVVSFEPHPRMFSMLEKSVKKNNIDNIVSVNKAASDENKTITMFSNHSNAGKTTAMSVNKFDEKIETAGVRVDDYLKEVITGKVGLIKIDSEGFELDVLSGLTKILKTDKPTLVIEFSPILYNKIDPTTGQLIIHLLHRFGYEILSLSGKPLDTTVLLSKQQTNILCR